jgi:hypothetical protein
LQTVLPENEPDSSDQAPEAIHEVDAAVSLTQEPGFGAENSSLPEIIDDPQTYQPSRGTEISALEEQLRAVNLEFADWQRMQELRVQETLPEEKIREASARS